MKDRELFVTILEDLGLYTKSQIAILKTLNNLEVSNTASATKDYLSKTTNVSYNTIATSLKLLLMDGVISKSINERNTYIFNQEKISRLLEMYKIKY